MSENPVKVGEFLERKSVGTLQILYTPQKNYKTDMIILLYYGINLHEVKLNYSCCFLLQTFVEQTMPNAANALQVQRLQTMRNEGEDVRSYMVGHCKNIADLT